MRTVLGSCNRYGGWPDRRGTPNRATRTQLRVRNWLEFGSFSKTDGDRRATHAGGRNPYGSINGATNMAKRIANATPKPARKSASAKPATAPSAPKRGMKESKPGTVKLLSGGNPQIGKADGDAPVQTYIAAMPGWKSDVGRRLDTLIVRTVPGVRKAVRWNTPFYGIEGQGWFIAFHCITKYVKVSFFRGTSLQPVPPVESKVPNVRYLHIHEGDWGGTLDEERLVSWIKQAAKIPGEECF